MNFCAEHFVLTYLIKACVFERNSHMDGQDDPHIKIQGRIKEKKQRKRDEELDKTASQTGKKNKRNVTNDL